MDDRTNLMSPRPLNVGSTLAGYKIREVIGISGLGITYRAYDRDTAADHEVAIGEFLPSSLALRQIDNHLQPISAAHEQRYILGLTNFLRVASRLNRFRHKNIVKVSSVFKQNNTAYMVMDCEHGVSLDSFVNQCGTLEQSHQNQIFFPIFDGLQKIHELGLVHRSITPTNIRIRENGTPVLLDFGSAQHTSLLSPTQSTALINQSYMPLEQFSRDYGEQGPWTDIYSLAAIMHQGVTGSKPDEALIRSDYMLRSQPDTVEELSTAHHPAYEQAFLRAVHAGLTLQPQVRPQSVDHWRLLFDGNFKAYLNQSAAVLSKSTVATGSSKEISSSANSSLSNTRAQPIGIKSTRDTIQQPSGTSSTTNLTINELDTALGSSAAAKADEAFRNAAGYVPNTKAKTNRWKLIVAGCAIAVCIALVVGIMFL